MPPIDSAARCLAAFCEIRKTRASPPSEEMVVQRSSIFHNTATYYNYVQHLKNACLFLRLPTAWNAPAVRHIAKGVKKCQDKSFKFSNFIRSSVILQLVERRSMQDEFAQACAISFLSAFRVPSETLALVRAFSSDLLLGFSAQKEKALINVMTVGELSFLVAKFPNWKNIASGCILKRPSFCGIGSERAGFLRPAHFLWHWIRRRVACGQQLFTTVTKRNSNRTLKKLLGELSTPEANRYSPPRFSAQCHSKASGSWARLASDHVRRNSEFASFQGICRYYP